jgi:hypothetical protein
MARQFPAGRWAFFACGLLFTCAATVGCAQNQCCDVDFSSSPPRFVINHQGWPRPFWVPRITEFAVASEEDEDAIWQLEAADSSGVPAKRLVIVFGEVPDGFVQVRPEKSAPPKTLQQGRTYYVAAGSRQYTYPMAFRLPMGAAGPASITTRPSLQP